MVFISILMWLWLGPSEVSVLHLGICESAVVSSINLEYRMSINVLDYTMLFTVDMRYWLVVWYIVP
jgi:hypothetical protein